MAKENNQIPPTKHEPLPDWAQRMLQNLPVPEQTISPMDMTLSNGMRLIVQPEHNTRTVVVSGSIDSNPGAGAAGKEGIRDVTAGSSRTERHVRSARLSARSSIRSRTTEAGTEFGVGVLSSHFERGVELLADEELHPAFAEADFEIVAGQMAGGLTGEMTSPDHLTQVALNKALYPVGDPRSVSQPPRASRR